MRHLPNTLTVLRLLLVPLTAYFLASQRYSIALCTFLIAAVTDFADGYIARRWQITSKLGAALDPIADKLNMAVATVVLAVDGRVPMWLAAAIVIRDVVIVAGALAYRAVVGHLEITPTQLSKLNTFFEFSVLILVMAVAAGWMDGGAWLYVLFGLVLATILGSAVQYVWLWGRKALDQSRTRS